MPLDPLLKTYKRHIKYIQNNCVIQGSKGVKQMARSTRTHLPPRKTVKSPLIPKHLAKDEFARRLYKLMVDRGWRQADLARHAALPRNAISVYLRGASLPNPESLKALAKALDMD